MCNWKREYCLASKSPQIHFLAANQSSHHEQIGLNRNSIFAELNRFILINCVKSIQVSKHANLKPPCARRIPHPPPTSFINMSKSLWDIDWKQWSTDGQRHGPVYKLYLKYIIFPCQPRALFSLTARCTFQECCTPGFLLWKTNCVAFTPDTG